VPGLRALLLHRAYGLGSPLRCSTSAPGLGLTPLPHLRRDWGLTPAAYTHRPLAAGLRRQVGALQKQVEMLTGMLTLLDAKLEGAAAAQAEAQAQVAALQQQLADAAAAQVAHASGNGNLKPSGSGAGTGLTPPTSAPGLRSLKPELELEPD
jgi:hypothetical protein